MSLYWVVYKDGDLPPSIFISESSSLLHANMKAALAGAPGKFAEGYMLDAKTAKKVPKRVIGLVLSHEEAVELLEGLS